MAVKNTTNHVKLEFLKEISEGSSDLMRDLITLFTTQVPTFSNQMDAYFKNNDYCNLAKLAHKIKNSVAMMGIEELVSDMKKLEKVCNESPNAEVIKNYIDKFKRIASEATIELNDILKDL